MPDSNDGDSVGRTSQESLEALVTNSGDIRSITIDSGETNSVQNDASHDSQPLIAFGSAQPVDMASNLFAHTFWLVESQPVEVEPHDTEPTAEVPFARIPRLFGPDEDFPVQFATQVQVVNPVMDLDLYLATHPYDHETTAEILVENPDVPAVEVIETTVHEDQHIHLHPPPDEQVFVNIVQNNTENEGVADLPEITVSPPEVQLPTEDGPLPITELVGNNEQVTTTNIDSPILPQPDLEQLPAVLPPSSEAADQPTVTATHENSQQPIDTTAHLAVSVSPLAGQRRSKSSSIAHRPRFNDRRRKSIPETKPAH